MHQPIIVTVHFLHLKEDLISVLASVPGLPRYVRVLICGGGNNAVRTGKAWAD